MHGSKRSRFIADDLGGGRVVELGNLFGGQRRAFDDVGVDLVLNARPEAPDTGRPVPRVIAPCRQE